MCYVGGSPQSSFLHPELCSFPSGSYLIASALPFLSPLHHPSLSSPPLVLLYTCTIPYVMYGTITSSTVPSLHLPPSSPQFTRFFTLSTKYHNFVSVFRNMQLIVPHNFAINNLNYSCSNCFNISPHTTRILQFE